MRTTSRVVLIAVVVWLGGAAAAWAADTCYLFAGTAVLVLKNFSPPSTVNGCKLINGYAANTPCAVSGNACRSADNSAIVFQTETRILCGIEVAWVVDTTTNSGIAIECDDATVNCSPLATVEKIPCPADRPFLPLPPS